MSDLAPCPACRRHVRIDEPACPFCSAALPAASPRTPGVGRFTRAAVFAGAIAGTAACGGKSKPPDNNNNNLENVAVDGGVDEQQPPDAAPYIEPDRDPDNNIPMPYGAPPVRARVV